MRWPKVATVASTEFNTAVRSRAFLVSLVFLPIIMVGSALLQRFAAKQVDTGTKTFALVDRTGKLAGPIGQVATLYNKTTTDEKGESTRPTFEPEMVEPAGRSDAELAAELSGRVRKGELFAFAVIPADIFEVKPLDPAALRKMVAGDLEEDDRPKIRYYSNNPNDSALLDWLTATVNTLVQADRLKGAGIAPEKVAMLSQPVQADNLMLADTSGAAASEAGEEAGARKVDRVRSALVPAVLMFVVFMIVMSTTPAMLQSVIEEKMSKISEVLLGSLTPFELMMGKLLGGVGVALVLATLYVGGGFAVASYYGYADAVSPELLAATAMFIVLAVFLFGSLYLAIGSACSELKDAQSLMMPVMLLSMFPVFVWAVVLRAPSSPLAVGLSLFPPATPYLMLMRMALQPAPPAWQVGLSVVLTLATVVACVWAAARIFRVGLLMQGKPPSFAELARWVVAR